MLETVVKISFWWHVSKCSLQLEISGLQTVRDESELLSSRLKTMTYQLETERLERESSSEAMRRDKETAEEALSAALTDMENAKGESMELRALLSDLEQRHETLKAESTERLESLKEELRR